MRNRGFTTIELLVVVAVLGVLATLTVPRLGNSLNDARLNSAARRLVTDIQYVRQMSITDSVVWSIEFLPNNGQYRIYRGTVEQTKHRGYFPVGVKMTPLDSSKNPFCFNKFGEATVFATARLYSEKTGRALFVIVNRTGRIRLSSEPPDS